MDDVTVTQADRDAVEATGLWLSTFEKTTLAAAFARHRTNHAQAEPLAWMYESKDFNLCETFKSRYDRDFGGKPEDYLGWTETPLYTHPPAQDVAALVSALEQYADQFCELGPYTEACGRLDWEQCSGCLARTALANFGDKP